MGVQWASVFKSDYLALEHPSESPLLDMFTFVKKCVLILVALKFWMPREEELSLF